MKNLLLLTILFLSGCATNPYMKEKVVIQYEYIIRQADASLKKKPPYPDVIDPSTADQIALANWLYANEKRMRDLESTIDKLINFYERPLTTEETQMLKKKSEAANNAAASIEPASVKDLSRK